MYRKLFYTNDKKYLRLRIPPTNTQMPDFLYLVTHQKCFKFYSKIVFYINK